MNRQKLLMVLVLSFAFVFTTTTAFAALTLNSNAVSSDGVLTLTGADNSTWDLGASHTLSLQTTNNGPITTGTGLFTTGGALSVTGNIIASVIRPSANSTTAIQINKADGTTNVLNVDTTNSRIGIGTLVPLGKVHANMGTLAPLSSLVSGGGGFVLTNDSSAQFTGVGANNTANTGGLSLRSVRARGTVDTPLVVQSGDTLLTINTDAWDGTSRVGTMASIDFLAEGTIATGRIPTRMTFSTATNAASSVLTERMRIDSAGNVGIGTASPGVSNLLELTSTTKGFVLPRMTKAQRDAIATPVAGMAVYQTDNTPGLRVYNSTNWMRYTETAD